MKTNPLLEIRASVVVETVPKLQAGRLVAALGENRVRRARESGLLRLNYQYPEKE